VFDDLYLFASAEVMLYSGDIDMMSGILTKLMNHMKSFPQLTTLDKEIDAKVRIVLSLTLSIQVPLL